MKQLILTVIGLVLIAVPVFATGDLVTGPAEKLDGSEEVQLPANLIGWTGGIGELDELVGDTVHVGTSPWDAQHNSKAARQIAFHMAAQWETHIIFAKLFGLNTADPRHTVYSKVVGDGAGGMTVETAEYQVENGYRSGYTSLSFDPAANRIFPGYHYAQNAGEDFSSASSIENPFIPGLFTVHMVPAVFALPHVWPMSVYGQGGAQDGYIHMISHEQRAGNTDPMGLSYMRWSVDAANGSLIPAVPNDEPILVTDVGMNISGDVAVSDDGSKVAIGLAVTRHETIGELWGTLGDSQVDNDVYVFLSDDYGATWDLDNPVDATQYAYEDTMRVYADCSVLFDDSDRLHVAYSAATGEADTGTSYVTSRVYHYMQDDDGNDWWTLIHHEPFPGYQPEAWGRTADRPCLYYDDATGILWCLYRAFGGGEYDYGANSGQGNGDIYISASPPGPYNGLLWTQGVNITNTNWTVAGGAPSGECQSEMSPGMAVDSDGNFLHISYLVDLDAGVGISSTPAGDITENPYVYHRVNKQELLDLFEANAAWVQNFPMHVDETGYWVDSGNWEWDEYGGFFTTNREPLPASLDLIPLQTTVPQAGGTVTYQVHFTSDLPMTIPGVTYWTMVVLPNGQDYGPILQQQFTVTPFMDVTVPAALQVPGWAPPGFYDFSGHVGFYPVTTLTDNFMFWKLGNGADATSGPDEWNHSEIALGEETEAVELLPDEFELTGVYPNPFNPTTTVSVALPEAAQLAVSVYNVQGQRVATLVDGPVSAGTHAYVLDGSALASGVYFVHATVPNRLNAIQKVTLLK